MGQLTFAGYPVSGVQQAPRRRLTSSRIALAVHRLVLRTGRSPLRWLWVVIYRGIARAGATYLTWGEKDAATYVRAGVGIGDLLPGISDVDMAVVLADYPAGLGTASERVRERWQRLYRALPSTRLLLDRPRVYDDADLRDLVGASALTYGLDDVGETTADRATYFGDRASIDRIRMSDRPGLYGATADWRILTGPDRRPPEPSRDAQGRRIAGWLELLYWWRWVFAVCVDPTGPRTAALCVRLVAEPARIWLWLAYGERAAGRTDALQRAARRMPDEEDALRRALDLERSLPRSPDPPLADVLPTMVRLSARIAGLIAAELADMGTTAVRLSGTDSAVLVSAGQSEELADTLVGGRDAGTLPLCDWRSLVYPALADESFLPILGDPGEPTVLADATRAQSGGLVPCAARRRPDDLSSSLARGYEVAGGQVSGDRSGLIRAGRRRFPRAVPGSAWLVGGAHSPPGGGGAPGLAEDPAGTRGRKRRSATRAVERSGCS